MSVEQGAIAVTVTQLRPQVIELASNELSVELVATSVASVAPAASSEGHLTFWRLHFDSTARSAFSALL